MGQLVDIKDGLEAAGYKVITGYGGIKVADGNVQLGVMLAGTSTVNARSRQRQFFVDVWQIADTSRARQVVEDELLTTVEAIETTLLDDCGIRNVEEVGRQEAGENDPRYSFAIRLLATAEN